MLALNKRIGQTEVNKIPEQEKTRITGKNVTLENANGTKSIGDWCGKSISGRDKLAARVGDYRP